MRISDWSSDVCSSDLLICGLTVGLGLFNDFRRMHVGQKIEPIGVLGQICNGALVLNVSNQVDQPESSEIANQDVLGTLLSLQTHGIVDRKSTRLNSSH